MSIKFIQWRNCKELEKIADGIHGRFTCEVPIDIDYIAEMMGLEIFDMDSAENLRPLNVYIWSLL